MTKVTSKNGRRKRRILYPYEMVRVKEIFDRFTSDRLLVLTPDLQVCDPESLRVSEPNTTSIVQRSVFSWELLHTLLWEYACISNSYLIRLDLYQQTVHIQLVRRDGNEPDVLFFQEGD